MIGYLTEYFQFKLPSLNILQHSANEDELSIDQKYSFLDILYMLISHFSTSSSSSISLSFS